MAWQKEAEPVRQTGAERLAAWRLLGLQVQAQEAGREGLELLALRLQSAVQVVEQQPLPEVDLRQEEWRLAREF